jgi:large subunit ribosomal protein L25
MERVKLAVRRRSGVGTKEARTIRAGGDVPGIIYSSSSDPVPIAVNMRDLRQAVATGGSHAILAVALDGDGASRPAIIKEMQLDPLKDRVIHVDLHAIRLDQPIVSTVPVVLVGDPEGVNMGGSLSAPVHEVHVEALPADIPENVTADVSSLGIGESLRLSDLTPPDGVTFVDDLEGTVLATVSAPISEAELETEVEAEAREEAEAAEAAAAEAAEAAGEGGEPE